MNKALQYDDFIKDSDWIANSAFQPMYVRINGEEYPIKEWYSDCEEIDDPQYPDLREECNHRIVFEV